MRKRLSLQAVILLCMPLRWASSVIITGIISTTMIPTTTTPAPALPLCSAGYTGPSDNCAACSAGKYKSSAGSGVCQDCEPGKYQDTVGATACDECVQGKYSIATGANDSSACSWCNPGKYSSAIAASACSFCIKGKYSPTVGANDSSTCTPCPEGTFSNVTASVSAADCELCSAGSYQAASGASACMDCAKGKYSTQTGASSSAYCLRCQASFYQNTVGATACFNCPISPGGRQTFSGIGSASVDNCTNDVIDLESSASAACNKTVFEANIERFKDGIATTAGADRSTVQIVSYAQVNSSQTSRRLLSGIISVEFNFRIAVPRYFSSEAVVGLSDLAAWVQEEGLPGLTVGATTASCGAGAEPDPSNPVCRACDFGLYKNASDNSSCVQCPSLSTTQSQGAFLLSQCECVPGYYSTNLLAFNVSCSECGLGYYCTGGLHRSLCPERMELPGVSSTSSSCQCSPGYQGPNLGPCVCEASSNRFLEIRVNSSAEANGIVFLSVHNVSNSSQGEICGHGGAGCVPFLIFYTLDGSMPNASSSMLCSGNGWRADECIGSWQASMPLYFVEPARLRAIVLRQGYHPDVCVAFGGDVSSYQVVNSTVYPGSHTAGMGSPYSASVECNVAIEFSQFLSPYNITPAAPRVDMFPSFTGSREEASAQGLLCRCLEALCCYNETLLQVSDPLAAASASSLRGPWMRANGTGPIMVSLSSASPVIGSPNLIR